jgi:hypothetical protein
MGRHIGPLLERARAVQRELVEEARAAYRSAPVPFAPNPPPRGWLHLEDDIAEEFAPLVSRPYEIDDALELLRVRKRAARREQYLLADGLSQREEKARKKALRELRLLAGYCKLCWTKRAPESRRLCAEHLARERECIQRRLRAGLCVRCSQKRAPYSKRFCADHLKSEAKYQHDRAVRVRAAGGDPYISIKRAIRRRRQEEVKAGRCYNLCGRTIRSAPRKPGPKAPVFCEPCSEAMRARSKRGADTRRSLRDAAERAGLCRMLCGRPIRKTTLLRSAKPPVYCEECARKQRERSKRGADTRRSLRDAAERAGLCRMLCGRPIRKTTLLRSAKPPVYCEECAKKQRERTAAYQDRRRAEGGATSARRRSR